jgi:hypothetical protein
VYPTTEGLQRSHVVAWRLRVSGFPVSPVVWFASSPRRDRREPPSDQSSIRTIDPNLAGLVGLASCPGCTQTKWPSSSPLVNDAPHGEQRPNKSTVRSAPPAGKCSATEPKRSRVCCHGAGTMGKGLSWNELSARRYACQRSSRSGTLGPGDSTCPQSRHSRSPNMRTTWGP